MSLESDLLDRIHAINGTISYSKLTAYRYYPGNAGKFPWICPLLAPATYNALGTYQGGDSVDVQSERTITLLCGVGSPLADIPVATAHKNAENIIEPILNTYYQLPYLRYNNADFGACSDAIRFENDSGLVLSDQTGLFEVRFSLIVPLIRNF